MSRLFRKMLCKLLGHGFTWSDDDGGFYCRDCGGWHDDFNEEWYNGKE